MLGACLSVAGGGAQTAQIEAVGAAWLVTIDKAPFTELRHEDQPFPILFPLRTPSGIAVTRGHPMQPGPDEAADHPHHRSLWFAHGDTNGADFWTCAHGERVRVDPDAARTGHGELSLRCAWLGRDGKPVACDQRSYRFAAEAGAWLVDFTITLQAAYGPVVLGDTKEGTFALRVASWLQASGKVATGTLRDSERRQGDAVWGGRARWIDCTGTVGGRRAGVALLDHPGNLRHPTHWHARRYGLLAANPFGLHELGKAPKGSGAVRLERGDSLTLRYRVVVHDGELRDEEVDAHWRRFAGPEPPASRPAGTGPARTGPGAESAPTGPERRGERGDRGGGRFEVPIAIERLLPKEQR